MAARKKKRKSKPAAKPEPVRVRMKSGKKKPLNARQAGRVRAREITPDPAGDPLATVDGASWEEIEFEFITGNRSLKEMARRHKRRWAALWKRSRDGSWQDKRVVYMGELRSEARERILRGIADTAVEAFEDLLERLGVAATGLLDRLNSDIKPGEAPIIEVIEEVRAPGKDGKTARKITRRKPPNVDGPFQRAVLVKYVDALGLVLGLATDGQSSSGSHVSTRGGPTQMDSPDDLARRSMDAQRAAWATEIGEDYIESEALMPAVAPGKGVA